MRVWLMFLSVLACARVGAAPSHILLVRHAEKADTGGKDPSLSERGRERAEALADRAVTAGVNQLFTSEYQRTIQTGAPTASRQHLEAAVIAARETSTLVARLVELPSTAVVLVVGHSNTVPMIAAALGASGVEPMDEAEYDRLIVLTATAEGGWTVEVSRYGSSD
jgi:broad specificity phosphatase PhoE